MGRQAGQRSSRVLDPRLQFGIGVLPGLDEERVLLGGFSVLPHPLVGRGQVVVHVGVSVIRPGTQVGDGLFPALQFHEDLTQNPAYTVGGLIAPDLLELPESGFRIALSP